MSCPCLYKVYEGKRAGRWQERRYFFKYIEDLFDLERQWTTDEERENKSVL